MEHQATSAYDWENPNKQGREIFPAHIKHEILSRVDIVGIIKKFLPLKKKGKDFVCKCPFHRVKSKEGRMTHERSPSFHVEPSKQVYQCYACGAQGDSITFLMKLKRMNSIAALFYLGKEVGMSLRFGNTENGHRRVYVANTLPEFYGKSIESVLGYQPDTDIRINRELQMLSSGVMSDDTHFLSGFREHGRSALGAPGVQGSVA